MRLGARSYPIPKPVPSRRAGGPAAYFALALAAVAAVVVAAASAASALAL